MRTRLIALAATLGMAALAVSLASATTPSGGSVSSGGGGGGSGGSGHSGGGGGGHSGGGSGGGGHSGGGGGYGGGHFGGGGYRGGGGFRGGSSMGGGYRGGGSGSQASFMARGGYVSHGSHGYHVVGFESAGLAHASAIPRAGQASRITLALGPRMGSAATAARMDGVARVVHTGIARMARVDRMHPHPGHPPRHPKRPHVRPEHSYATPAYSLNRTLPMFCGFWPPTTELDQKLLAFPPYGCLEAVKAKPASMHR